MRNQAAVPALAWYLRISIGCGTGSSPTSVPCCRNRRISDSSVRPLHRTQHNLYIHTHPHIHTNPHIFIQIHTTSYKSIHLHIKLIHVHTHIYILINPYIFTRHIHIRTFSQSHTRPYTPKNRCTHVISHKSDVYVYFFYILTNYSQRY